MTYTFWECLVCEYTVVLRDPRSDPPDCAMCAEDNGRWVGMKGRPATADDKPEGIDQRECI